MTFAPLLIKAFTTFLEGCLGSPFFGAETIADLVICSAALFGPPITFRMAGATLWLLPRWGTCNRLTVLKSALILFASSTAPVRAGTPASDVKRNLSFLALER